MVAKNSFTIPSMGGERLAKFFKYHASKAPDGSALVELGTWLGSGTLPLIQGVASSARDVEVHSYDDFVIRGNEVDKAALYGVSLKDGQDSLPLVKKWLSGYKVKLHLHKGEITETKWNKRPIYMYIDDACKYKDNFLKALRIFSPYWIPGQALIVLMDFFFYLKRPQDEGLKFQKEFMDSHADNFKCIYENQGICTAIFRYQGGLKI